METKTKQKRIARNFDLSPAEELLIWRKRKRYDQHEAAKKLKVSYFSYKMAENGHWESFKYPVLEIRFNLLSNIEKCLLYRKRAKLTQAALAKEIGISRYWLLMQETGQISPDKLLAWWEARS